MLILRIFPNVYHYLHLSLLSAFLQLVIDARADWLLNWSMVLLGFSSYCQMPIEHPKYYEPAGVNSG